MYACMYAWVYLVAGRGRVFLLVDRVILRERLHELRQPAAFHHHKLREGSLLRPTQEKQPSEDSRTIRDSDTG